MISNRCARKSLVTNCNSIISKNYLRLLVDSNDNVTEVMTGSISIHVVSDFLKRKFIQPKTQGRLIQNASTFKLKHKYIRTKT